MYESDRTRGNEIEELKQRNQSMEMMSRERFRNLESKHEAMVGEFKRMKEQVEIKQSELENALNQKASHEKEARRVKEENEMVKQRLIQQEKEKIKEQEELRHKLEQSNAYQIENLKTAFNTQVSILQSENQDLKAMIDQKCKDIQDLLDK